MGTPCTIQERLASGGGTALVQEWLRDNQGKGRVVLARHVCERLGLRDARGQLRQGGAQKALRILEARGYWRWPKRQSRGPGRWKPRRLGRRVAEPRKMPERVEQVQRLCLVEVSRAQEELFRTWNELIETEHPLHDRRMVGRQVRYLIGSEHGWLGALGFGSCALRLAPRDEWIGWDDARRKGFQDRVLDLRRFLIRPSVRCQNWASRVLSMAAERGGPDFARRYGLEPWLLESFVNTGAHEGTCYPAANWLSLGQSTGRGRNGSNDPQVARRLRIPSALPETVTNSKPTTGSSASSGRR